MKFAIYIIAIALTMVLYQNCSGRHESLQQTTGSSASTSLDDVDRAKSLVAFQNSLYPITQETGSCTECHGVDQQPLHSTSDPNFAHDVMLSFGLVNLRNPEQSRIYERINDGSHDGRELVTQAMAARIRTAIEQWSAELVANGGLRGVGDGLQPTYTSISTTILEARCIACHAPGEEAESILYDSYVNARNTGGIVPESPNTSLFLTHDHSQINSSEPVDALTEDEQATIREWIQTGALNN